MLLMPYTILITSYNNIFRQVTSLHVHSSSLIAVNKRESKHHVYIMTPGMETPHFHLNGLQLIALIVSIQPDIITAYFLALP